MKRLVPFALILSVLGGVMAPVPVLAGGFSFDLPVLTWPTDGQSVLATKSDKR